MGMLMSCFPTVLISPWAMESQRTMPPGKKLEWSGGSGGGPKMLTKTAVTLGSLVMSLKASSIALAVAPPPQSSLVRFQGSVYQGSWLVHHR